MVRKAELKDVDVLVELAKNVWKDDLKNDLKEHFFDSVVRDDFMVFVKEIENLVVGFAQCGVKVEENNLSNFIGYFDGVFVDEKYRGKGIAKELLAACEKWVKDKGCNVFTSGCEFAKRNSANLNSGTLENQSGNASCFRKKLK